MKAVTRHLVVAVAGASVLAGCVVMPTAPAVTSLPGSRKTLAEFNVDDVECRRYAQGAVGPYAGQAAQDYAVGSAVAGTAIGALAGAAIGSVSANAGAGAAIGAGTGLLFGSAIGSDAAGYSSWSLQRIYDRAYMQCMYAKGNQVPGQVAFRAPLPSYPGYRAPGTNPPSASGSMPYENAPGYRPPPAPGANPPPSPLPPPGGFPPANAPPPPQG